MRKRTAREVQQLKHLVKTHRVAATRCANGERPLEPRDVGGGEQRFAGAHPVAVTLHGVDLAVMCDEAIRVRKRPRRKRVGAKAAVHQDQRRLHVFIRQIGEEHAQLGRGEHSFIYERARRQRSEIRALFGGQLVLGALAGNKEFAVEVDVGFAGARGDKAVFETRHHASRARPQARRVDGHAAPPEHLQAFFVERAGDRRLGFVDVVRVSGEERKTHRVRAARGQRYPCHLAHELVRHLQQDARTVARVGLGSGGAAVLHAAQRTQPGLHDAVAGETLYMHHERYAARVVLEARVI